MKHKLFCHSNVFWLEAPSPLVARGEEGGGEARRRGREGERRALVAPPPPLIGHWRKDRPLLPILSSLRLLLGLLRLLLARRPVNQSSEVG